MDTCENGRIHDGNGYDRGICGTCNGSGCPMKTYKATFDCHYTVKIQARDETEAAQIAKKFWRKGFDFSDLVEVKQ